MCSRCGDANHKEEGVGTNYPPLALKAQSQYETPYMTVNAFTGSFTLAGNASGDIGTLPIAVNGLNPRHLHQQPGISVNAYPIIKDPVVNIIATGAIVALPSFVGILYYVDYAGARYVLGGFSISLLTATILNFTALTNTAIVIPATPFTSAMPSDLGKLVVTGPFVLASATNVTFQVACNVGFTYGVPR